MNGSGTTFFPAPEKAARFVRLLRVILIALFLIGFGFAIEAPDDILSRFPLLREFTSLMKQVAPVIGKTVAKSSFPEVTELYLSVSWLLSPLYFLYEWGRYHCVIGSGTKRSIEIMNRRPTGLRWTLNTVMILFVTIIWFSMLCWYDGIDFNIVPFNSNRVALGLLGWLIAGGYIVAVAYSLLLIIFNHLKWIRVFIKVRWSR